MLPSVSVVRKVICDKRRAHVLHARVNLLASPLKKEPSPLRWNTLFAKLCNQFRQWRESIIASGMTEFVVQALEIVRVSGESLTGSNLPSSSAST